MEPIEGIEDIQKSRWKLICYICQKRHGAPIQCASKNCFVAFHVTCARRAKLCLKMRGHDVTDSAHFRAYCDRHSPVSIQHVKGLIISFRRTTKKDWKLTGIYIWLKKSYPQSRRFHFSLQF
jgi:PHD-like zinc-binding domain